MGGAVGLDLLALDHAWVGEALDAAVQDAEGRPFASLPFLVLMKLESGRLQDLADISRMLGCASEDRVDAEASRQERQSVLRRPVHPVPQDRQTGVQS